MQMVKKRICIAGGIATGKSFTANLLAERYNLDIISFSKLLKDMFILNHKKAPNRTDLQKYGNTLVAKYNYNGLLELFIQYENKIDTNKTIIIDGFRRFDFFLNFKNRYANSLLLFHTCSSENQIKRIMKRDKIDKPNISLILNHDTEKQITKLANVADIIINTDNEIKNIINEKISSFISN